MPQPRRPKPDDLKETTTGGWFPRNGSLYWYPLNMLQEIVVYPLLFGQARLVRGRRDKDSWEVGYDYPDIPTAMKAAGQWDGQGDPGFGWLQRHEGEEEEDGDAGETDDLNGS